MSLAQNLSSTPVNSPTPTISQGTATPTPTPLATPTSTAVATPIPTLSPTPSPISNASSLTVVVNKKRPLNPINYAPANLVKPVFDTGAASNPFGLSLAKPAAKAIKLMANAMKAAGAGTLILESTYRSYSDQTAVHAKDVAKYGLAVGENLAARPGYSEHQTGLAADVGAVGFDSCRIRVCFAKTAPGMWLAANSWQFGFILRYPDGQTAITGYQFEPWHYRYIGVDLSTAMHNAGYKTLERFLKVPDAPSY